MIAEQVRDYKHNPFGGGKDGLTVAEASMSPIKRVSAQSGHKQVAGNANPARFSYIIAHHLTRRIRT